MQIVFDGETLDYDPRRIDMATAIAIREHTGRGMLSWEKGIDDADPVCLQALLWAIQRQNGVCQAPTPKRLMFEPLAFWEALRDAAQVELAEKIAAQARLVEAGEAEVPDPPRPPASV